ncbi:MAG: hypothetical protein ABIO02_02295, partial [Patescibacteria group bacterium]
GWWPDYQVKIFKKQHVKWNIKIHSLPNYHGNVKVLPARKGYSLVHYNISSINQFIEKIQRYTDHEANVELSTFNEPDRLVHYFEDEFTDRYIDKLGHLDGIHGYMLSKLMEFYRFVEICKVWEREKYRKFTDNNKLHQYILRDIEIKKIKYHKKTFLTKLLLAFEGKSEIWEDKIKKS